MRAGDTLIRSYEYYEIRRNLGKDDEELVKRFSYRQLADRMMSKLYSMHTKHDKNVYLVRVTLLEAIKQEDNEAELRNL